MAPAKGAPASDRLTLEEVEMLSRRYEVKGSGKGDEAEVNYWKLCEQVEKVFTLRGLEKNPTLDVKLSLEDRPDSGYGTNRPGLSVEEADVVGGLLSRVRLFAATEGLIVKELFETFDKMHSGRVTATVFLRQLDSMFKGKLSKSEARRDAIDQRRQQALAVTGLNENGLLLRAYQTRDGDVSYRAMHVDCENTTAGISGLANVSGDLPRQKRQQQRENPTTEHRRHKEPTEHLNNRVPEDKGQDGGGRALFLPSNRPRPSPSPIGSGDDSCHDETASVSSSVAGFPVPSTVCSSIGDMTFSEAGKGAMDGICGGGSGGGSGRGSRGGRAGRGGGRAGGPAGAGAGSPVVVGLRDSLPLERQMACKEILVSADTCAGAFGGGARRGGRWQRGGGGGRGCGGGGGGGGSDETQEKEQEQEEERQRKITDKALEEARRGTRRLFLQLGFQDFDRKGEGHVSVGQLKRVLCSYGVLPADPKTQELLERRYAATDDPRHPTGQFIAYRPLLEDLGEGAMGSSGGFLEIGHEGGDPRLKGAPVVTGAWDDEGDGGGGGCDGGDGGGSAPGCSASVGGGSGVSVAPSQLRVFGKATGLSRSGRVGAWVRVSGNVSRRLGLYGRMRAIAEQNPIRNIRLTFSEEPAHSVVSEVNMTSSVVLGRDRDRGVDELLAQLKAFTYRARLRMMEFFRDEDQMRSGTMSRENFGRDLLSTGFRISPVELETLCDAYADSVLVDKGGAPFVRYACLVEEVEGVFGVKELERKPECDVNASVKAAQASFTTSSVSGFTEGTSPLSKQEEAIVMETLRELGKEVHRRRLSLSPPLKDFDRFNRGVVPGTMFERALSLAGVLPVRRKTKLLRRKFAERFSSPDARSDVNYVAFLAAVDLAVAGHDKIPDGLLVRANGSTSGNPAGATARGAEGERKLRLRLNANANGDGRRRLALQDVVREVARQLAEGWADIRDFLNDADRFKQGQVSFPKLKVSLALAGVLLTDKELHIMQEGFRSDLNSDMVDWRRLAAAVNRGGGAPVERCWDGEIFDPSTSADKTTMVGSPSPSPSPRLSQLQGYTQGGEAGLLGPSSVGGTCGTARSMTSQCSSSVGGAGAGGGSTAASTWGSGIGGEEDEEEDAVDREVLEKALDADFDPNNKKKITRQQFRSVLGNMNLNLSEREQDAICRSYTVHERSPGARVRYAAFCSDVEPEERGAGAMLAA
eukprot:jgi/Undpi1/4087/HiC_scaffold_16.g07454.m1